VNPAAVPAAPAIAPKAEKPPVKPPAKPERPKAEEKAEEGPPEPETMFLNEWPKNEAGWRIHCLYYPPKPNVRKGEEVVPVIAVHGWGGRGAEYDFLARQLQLRGHAVMVPDLRGHGRSTTKLLPDGQLRTIKFDSSKVDDLSEIGDDRARMRDLEAVKRVLVEKNNKGEVNIRLLTVIAADVGCIVSLNWAVRDWSYPETAMTTQGRDVKALVLLTPVLSYKGQAFNQKLITNPPISNLLSIMITVGEKDRKGLPEAMRLHTRLERIRPPVPKDPQQARLAKDLFLIKADTVLAGTRLLDPQLPVNNFIAGFLNLRLVMQRHTLSWAKRESVLGGK
jgi:pimeloyl-ACP methyl ester carboxylesterase